MPVGSHGDVLPMVGLGRTLKARGHQVEILANPVFAPAVRWAGVDLIPLGTTQDYEAVAQDPDIHHPRKGLNAVSRVLRKHMRDAYRLLVERIQQGPAVLVGSTLAYPTRCAAEVHRLPVATIHLQPSVIRSLLDPPVLGGPYPLPRWLPRSWIAALWWLLDRCYIDPLLGGALNSLRTELGLTPVRRVLDQWLHQADLVMGLFPDWFQPRPADWPPHLHLNNFPLWDQESGDSLPPELEAFLQAGPAPIVLTGGTGFAKLGHFYKDAIRHCQRLGKRGLLLTRYRANLPEHIPPEMLHIEYAPFSRLLPRASALVHHGGIGTTAQGLAAGIPQLIVPQAHDQFDNGYRVVQLGVGLSGPMGRHLERLVTDSGLARRAAAISSKVRSGLEAAAIQLERIKRIETD